jgi:hypothetical protein
LRLDLAGTNSQEAFIKRFDPCSFRGGMRGA